MYYTVFLLLYKYNYYYYFYYYIDLAVQNLILHRNNVSKQSVHQIYSLF